MVEAVETVVNFIAEQSGPVKHIALPVLTCIGCQYLELELLWRGRNIVRDRLCHHPCWMDLKDGRNWMGTTDDDLWMEAPGDCPYLKAGL